MERRQNIGKAVREKMEGLHKSPGDGLWQSIDATLARKKRRKAFLWWGLAGVALFTAVVMFSLLPSNADPVPTGVPSGSGKEIDHQSKNQRPEAPSGNPSDTKPHTDESSQSVSDHQADVPDLKSGAAEPEQSGTANQKISASEKETKHRKPSTTSHTGGTKTREMEGSYTGNPTTGHRADASSKSVSRVNEDSMKANGNRKNAGSDSHSAGANNAQTALTYPDSTAEIPAALAQADKQRSNLLANEGNATAATGTVENITSVSSDTGGHTDPRNAAAVSVSTGHDNDHNGSNVDGAPGKAQAATHTPSASALQVRTRPDNEKQLTGNHSIAPDGNSNNPRTAGGPDKLPDNPISERTEAVTTTKDSLSITPETGKGTSKAITPGEISGYKGIFVYAHLDAGKYTKSSGGSLLDSSLDRNSTSADFPLQYGIYAGYHISDRWSVRTGITKKEITSATRNVDFNPDWTPNNPYFANISYPEQVTNLTLTNQFGQRGYTIEHKAQYLEVPAEVLYRILQGKFGLQVTGGVGILLVQENNVTARHELGSMYLGKLRTMKNTSISYNFGVSAYYELLSGLQLNAEPVFRYYPGAIEEHKFYTLGVQAGLQYNFDFFAKRK